MRTASQQKVTFLERDSAVPRTAIRDGVLRLPEVAETPVASVEPQLPAMIPDERLDYYAWVFCQRGFSSRQIGDRDLRYSASDRGGQRRIVISQSFVSEISWRLDENIGVVGCFADISRWHGTCSLTFHLSVVGRRTDER
jgi:hypothetical protein